MPKGKQNFLNKLIAKPKQIFLIDAFGALLTTLLLFGILTQFQQYFGMPNKVLYILSGTAFCLFIYSISCYIRIKLIWKPFLRILIIFNLLYSFVSLRWIIKYSDELTKFGWIYFILELIIIGIIVTIEYNSYSKLE